MLKPVSESLKLVQSRLGEMEKERVGAYTDLKTQIRYILSGNEALKNETARLSQALHHNSVRGQWGELQLRRVVELAGMVEYCDFTTQEPVPGRRNGCGRTWSFTFLEAVPSSLTRKRPWHPT